MVIIEPNGNHYTVRVIEKGFGTLRVRAESVQETTLAISHYYDPKNHPRDLAICPLCRQIE